MLRWAERLILRSYWPHASREFGALLRLGEDISELLIGLNPVGLEIARSDALGIKW